MTVSSPKQVLADVIGLAYRTALEQGENETAALLAQALIELGDDDEAS